MGFPLGDFLKKPEERNVGIEEAWGIVCEWRRRERAAGRIAKFINFGSRRWRRRERQRRGLSARGRRASVSWNGRGGRVFFLLFFTRRGRREGGLRG